MFGLVGHFDDLFEAAAELFDDHGLAVNLPEALLLGFLSLSEQTLAGGLHNLGGDETKWLPEKNTGKFLVPRQFRAASKMVED